MIVDVVDPVADYAALMEAIVAEFGRECLPLNLPAQGLDLPSARNAQAAFFRAAMDQAAAPKAPAAADWRTPDAENVLVIDTSRHLNRILAFDPAALHVMEGEG